MAENITEEQLADYKLVFSQFDENGDGYIDMEELRKMLESLGHPMTQAEVTRVMAEMDVDGNNEVDFAEFLALLAKRLMHSDNEEEIYEAFKVFDTDKNGEISANELMVVLTSLGEKLTPQECQEILRLADSDGDGVISFREFVRLLMIR